MNVIERLLLAIGKVEAGENNKDVLLGIVEYLKTVKKPLPVTPVDDMTGWKGAWDELLKNWASFTGDWVNEWYIKPCKTDSQLKGEHKGMIVNNSNAVVFRYQRKNSVDFRKLAIRDRLIKMKPLCDGVPGSLKTKSGLHSMLYTVFMNPGVFEWVDNNMVAPGQSVGDQHRRMDKEIGVQVVYDKETNDFVLEVAYGTVKSVFKIEPKTRKSVDV